MTATTSMPLGANKDHLAAAYYRFTIFAWDADLFHATCKTLQIDYQLLEDDEYHYYSIFQFTCDLTCLLFLTQRYQSAGRPFSLTNFNLKE